MKETTFTLRVDEELKAQFSSAAKEIDRTGAQLLRDFMRDFVRKHQEEVEYDAWFRRQVQAGIDSANAGQVYTNEEVNERFAKRREESLCKLQSR